MIRTWNHQRRYGIEDSYRIGMEWLDACDLVEDWGCALCHAKRYREGAYRGVDGTPGKADVIADLSDYLSVTTGLFMRHILEHNLDWRIILDNALESFTQRMSLILFLPTAEKDIVHDRGDDPPDIWLCERDLMKAIRPYLQHTDIFPRPKGLSDTVFRLEKL